MAAQGMMEEGWRWANNVEEWHVLDMDRRDTEEGAGNGVLELHASKLMPGSRWCSGGGATSRLGRLRCSLDSYQQLM
jgi:hypothetical protein